MSNLPVYDLSFMYTKKCDLSCPFCMYNSGPDINDQIDLKLLEDWLMTVDFDRISSFGVYGGEVAVDLAGFGACFDLVKSFNKPHFVITNGTWSTDKTKTDEFMAFVMRYRCHVVVSGTPWHRRHQDRTILEALKVECPSGMRLKPKEENFHAMGRLDGKMKFSCSQKCMSWDGPLRIAIQPDGNIIFQNCDGIYPSVGNINQPFDVIDRNIKNLRLHGFGAVCPHYEGNF